jgi:cell division transport system permease protein
VVIRPALLVADEPTGNLDAAQTWRVLRLLGEMHRMGTTVVVATHDDALVRRTRRRAPAGRRAAGRAWLNGRLRRSRGRDPLGLRRALADRLLPGLVAAMALLGAVALGGAEGAAELARRWQGGAGSACWCSSRRHPGGAAGRGAGGAPRPAGSGGRAGHGPRPHGGAAAPLAGRGARRAAAVVIELRLASLPASPAALAERVAAAVPGGGASVEAHGVWLARLAALARSLQGVAMAALLLVAGIAAAVVAVAVRAGIAARRQAIAILHELGATDSDIAGRFARRVALLAGAGALAGTAVAVPVLAALAGLAAPLLGGQASVAAELPDLPWRGLPWTGLALLPLIGAGIGWLTAQVAVRRWLRLLP